MASSLVMKSAANEDNLQSSGEVAGAQLRGREKSIDKIYLVTN